MVKHSLSSTLYNPSMSVQSCISFRIATFRMQPLKFSRLNRDPLGAESAEKSNLFSSWIGKGNFFPNSPGNPPMYSGDLVVIFPGICLDLSSSWLIGGCWSTRSPIALELNSPDIVCHLLSHRVNLVGISVSKWNGLPSPKSQDSTTLPMYSSKDSAG